MSRRVGLRTMPSIGGKAKAALPPGTYLSPLSPDPGAPTQTDYSNFPLVRGGALRRSFWHNGYAYIFFAEVTTLDVIYNSTSDGANYTKPSGGNPVVTKAERGNTDWAYQVDVYYDGANVYVVMAEQAVNGVVKIKKGTLSNGEITWGSWVTVVSAAQDSLTKNLVSLTKTADGYFWIAYVNISATFYDDVYCVRSTNPNTIASWQTPVLIYDAVAAGWRNIAVLPLSSSSVYIVYYNYSGAPLYQTRLFGKTFDGSTVGAEESITTMDIINDRAWGAVSDASYNICVLYQQYDGYDHTAQKIWLRRRVAGTWQSEVETPITPSPSWYNGISLTKAGANKLYLFYNEDAAAGNPYHRFFYGTWSPTAGFSSAVEVTTEDERMTANYNQEICSNYELQLGTLIGLWFRTTGPPSPLRCVIVSGLT